MPKWEKYKTPTQFIDENSSRLMTEYKEFQEECSGSCVSFDEFCMGVWQRMD